MTLWPSSRFPQAGPIIRSVLAGHSDLLAPDRTFTHPRAALVHGSSASLPEAMVDPLVVLMVAGA